MSTTIHQSACKFWKKWWEKTRNSQLVVLMKKHLIFWTASDLWKGHYWSGLSRSANTDSCWWRCESSSEETTAGFCLFWFRRSITEGKIEHSLICEVTYEVTASPRDWQLLWAVWIWNKECKRLVMHPVRYKKRLRFWTIPFSLLMLAVISKSYKVLSEWLHFFSLAV